MDTFMDSFMTHFPYCKKFLPFSSHEEDKRMADSSLLWYLGIWQHLDVLLANFLKRFLHLSILSSKGLIYGIIALKIVASIDREDSRLNVYEWPSHTQKELAHQENSYLWYHYWGCGRIDQLLPLIIENIFGNTGS